MYISDGDFYIGKRKTEIVNPILEGEPFFAGRATYAQTVHCDGKTAVSLRLNGRVHYAEISVNGKRAGDLLFDDELDLTDFLAKGENEIEITTYNSCRNKMGSFHFKAAEEPIGVSPGTFELFGTWKDGKSTEQVETYRFVRNGIE